MSGYELEYCYHNGNLDQALQQAAEFIHKIGDTRVVLVSTQNDDVGWTVFVVYESKP
jgi:hypothetical protein